jgi:hypothetical protein
MPSSLTWIDHDASARERSLRILALFQEKESRDELGLGGIRDSIADRLFPGTSTIQTRLRYMLFVPWIYQDLEERRVPSGDFARRADAAERDLIDTMRSADEREAGILGGRSGRQLKRLPSSVYWSGLGAWGIRVVAMPQDQYHRQIDMLYRRRKEQDVMDRERRNRGDDSERTPEGGTLTWHPRLPRPPEGFPKKANFTLTVEEASFLLDRIQRSNPSSLLAHLALNGKPANVDLPWEHPDRATFSSDHNEILDHARRFSILMHGAAIIYNIELAEERSWSEKVDEHYGNLYYWVNKMLDPAEIRDWPLDRFWELTMDYGHTITPATRRFVEQWRQITRDRGLMIGDDPAVREMIRRREMALKKSRSRFNNRRALDQWSGYSGLSLMTYRWRNAAVFLKDLHAGLHQKKAS